MRRLLLPVLVAALVLAACGGDDQPDETPDLDETSSEPDEEPDDVEEDATASVDDRQRSWLTGEPLDEDLFDRPLLLSKVENSPQARPQDGLDAADVVYEEVVEGGVTRFIAIFHSELPDIAGPIRSARPVDTQLMSAYGASVFAYSGARDEVRAMLAQTPSIRVTEGAAGFFRDQARQAPHNLYLRPAELLEGAVDRGAEPVGDVGWVFDEQPPEGQVSCPDTDGVLDCEDPGAGIEIPMTWDFTTTWEWDAGAQRYRRLQDGTPFEVTGEGRIGAANVVVLATRHYTSDGGYPETDVTTDDARAVVLRDGRRYEARWSKPAPEDDLVLTTVDGEPFPLAPGPTWLHLPTADALPDDATASDRDDDQGGTATDADAG